jgi:hypothetical protein
VLVSAYTEARQFHQSAQATTKGKIMHTSLSERIHRGAGGRIYASVKRGAEVHLECLGTYDDVRHRFNQMACLIGAVLLQKLGTHSSASVHSRSAAPGTWVDRFEGRPVGTPEDLYSLAAMPPSEAADSVGYLASHSDWPVGTTSLLSGYKSMAKSMCEMSNVFFAFENQPTAIVGCSPDVSAVKRVQEAISLAKKKGFVPYEEGALLKFMDTVSTARRLHFFHQVNPT